MRRACVHAGGYAGFQIGLKLLRCGATVIATSRFPKNTAGRYAVEPDFATWSHRLRVFGIDLRDLAHIDAMVDMIRDKCVEACVAVPLAGVVAAVTHREYVFTVCICLSVCRLFCS